MKIKQTWKLKLKTDARNSLHKLQLQALHFPPQNMFHGPGLYGYPGGSPGGHPHGPSPHHPGSALMAGGTFSHPAAEQALKLAQLHGINYAEWLARTGMYVSRMVDYPGGCEYKNLFFEQKGSVGGESFTVLVSFLECLFFF